MMKMGLARLARVSAVVAMTAFVAACASNSTTDPNASGLGGANTPGSIAEFQSAAVGDRVYFDTDSSEINAQGQTILERQAAWLNRYPRYSFTLEGHADERGTREYNFALGARRAEAVKNTSWRAALHQTASARFPMARNAPWRPATISPAGRRIAAFRPFCRAVDHAGKPRVRRENRTGIG